MARHVAQAGNTVVPGILAIESLGYAITAVGDAFCARKGYDELSADDSVALLGLVRLMELRSWD